MDGRGVILSPFIMHRIFIPIVLAVVMSINNNGVANVKSGWDSGEFVVLGNDNSTELIRVDGVNNTVDVRGVTVTSGGSATFDSVTAVNITQSSAGGTLKLVKANNEPVSGVAELGPLYETTYIISGGAPATIQLNELPTSPSAFFNVLLYSTSAQAHVVTLYRSGGAEGFNSDPTLDRATFGGAVGDYIRLMLIGGVYYTLDSRNVSLSTAP